MTGDLNIKQGVERGKQFSDQSQVTADVLVKHIRSFT